MISKLACGHPGLTPAARPNAPAPLPSRSDLWPDPDSVSCYAAFNHSARLPSFVERDGRWHHLAVTWEREKDGLTQVSACALGSCAGLVLNGPGGQLAGAASSPTCMHTPAVAPQQEPVTASPLPPPSLPALPNLTDLLGRPPDGLGRDAQDAPAAARRRAHAWLGAGLLWRLHGQASSGSPMAVWCCFAACSSFEEFQASKCPACIFQKPSKPLVTSPSSPGLPHHPCCAAGGRATEA